MFQYGPGTSYPESTGTGTEWIPATSATGEPFGPNGNGYIFVPEFYVSGEALSATSTFEDMTFADIGLTEGTYVWTWGSGATADSLTLNIVVPEPATMSLLAIGGVALLKRRKRK